MMDWGKIKVKDDFKFADVVAAARMLAEELVVIDEDGLGYSEYTEMERPMMLSVILTQFTDADTSEYKGEDDTLDVYAIYWDYFKRQADIVEYDIDRIYFFASEILSNMLGERKRKLDAEMSVGYQLKRIADKLANLDGKDMSVLRRIMTDMLIQQKKAGDKPSGRKTSVVDMSAYKPKKGKNE